MRLLLIGGGVFLGRALVDAALARGHQLTVFNRGRQRMSWPAGVQVLTGERQIDLPRLAGAGSCQRWDAVIDTCGYLPGELQASAAALGPSLDERGVYLFVSSVSAYAGLDAPGADETSPLADFSQVPPDSRQPDHYGAQKAACEAALTQALGAQALIVRPGLIVGPGDPTGRFSHWPWRCSEGGTMVVPAAPAESMLQCIDVRDLAGWMLQLLETAAAAPGPGPRCFNATSPPFGWQTLIAACREAVQRQGAQPATACPVDEARLLAAGVTPWAGLPLWIPADNPASRGFMAVDTRRAQARGLRTRPLADTAADILQLDPAPLHDPRRAARLDPATAQALLTAAA